MSLNLKNIATLTSEERGDLIAIVAYMNATGVPFSIFFRKKYELTAKKGAPLE